MKKKGRKKIKRQTIKHKFLEKMKTRKNKIIADIVDSKKFTDLCLQ